MRLHSWMVASLVVSQLLPSWNSPGSFSLVNAQHAVDVKIYHDGNTNFNSFSERLGRRGKNACCWCSCCVMEDFILAHRNHSREPPREAPRRRKKEPFGLGAFWRALLPRTSNFNRTNQNRGVDRRGRILLHKNMPLHKKISRQPISSYSIS